MPIRRGTWMFVTTSSPSRPPVGQQLARWGAGAVMALAGLAHLSSAREGFGALVPAWVPMDADDVVVVSGAVEIALGVGLVALPKERRRMAALLTAFLVAVFPANISQYVRHADVLGLDTDRKRFVRLLVEPLMWAVALHAGGLLPRRAARR